MINRADIESAVAVLRRGGVIVYPTDTVWGIGCDATNSDAVRRVFEIKRRADAKALISLVSDVAMLERWVDDIPDVAYELLDAAVNPLTVVYDHPRGLAPELLAGDGSAAVRVCGDAFCRALCRGLRKPVVSTSANVSGSRTPKCFSEINGDILGAADYVAQTRREDAGGTRPSSVIKLSSGGLISIIRK